MARNRKPISRHKQRQYRSGGGVSANARKQEALRAMIATRKRKAAAKAKAEAAKAAKHQQEGAKDGEENAQSHK